MQRNSIIHFQHSNTEKSVILTCTNKQCAKSYCSRHLLSVNWCPTLIRFVLFSSNVHTQSLLQLRLIDFSRGFFVWVQNYTKVAIFCNFVLDRSDLWRFAIKSWSEISLSSYNDEKKKLQRFWFQYIFQQ